ncbi:MAG: outer membrane beta-barrel protein [Pseudomonadota bacterium]
MKRMIAVAALVVATTTLPALGDEGAEETGGIRTGFIAGVQGGLTSTDVTLILDGNGVGTVDFTGGEGGVFAGYRVKADRFVGTLEVEALLSTGSEDVDSPIGLMQVESRAAAGISVTGGYVLAGHDPDDSTDGGEITAFARVGYRALLADVNAAGQGGTDVFHGLRYGGGLSYAITDAIEARVEYSRTSYRDQNYGSGRNTLTVGPSGDLVSFGLVYRF